ncbi:hypothetical protein ACLMJK_009693 [Lecanora helva]
MLSFKSYLPDDKDFGYSTNEEDHSTSLFEQYLNQEPIDFGSAVDNSDGAQGFDFTFDEEAESSESCSADSKCTSSLPTDPQPLASFNSPPLEEPLPIRLRAKFISGETPSRSISSSELLNLEGRSDQRKKAPASLISAAGAPTLRRKGKFCAPAAGAPYGRSHRVTKTPSAEMIRPSYHQESSSYNEWTQRFEQINIQGSTATGQSSPSRNNGIHRDKRPTKITTTFNQGHQQHHITQGHQIGDHQGDFSHGPGSHNSNFNHASTAPLPPEWQNHGLPGPSPLSSADYNFAGRPHIERSQTQHHLRQPSSWDYGPVSPLTPDFVSPDHIQPQWLHNLNSNAHSYNDTVDTYPPASALPNNNGLPDFPAQDLTPFPHEPYAQFVNEDPSTDYAVLSPDRFFAPSAEVLTTPLPPGATTTKGPGEDPSNNNTSTTNPPQTPPRRSSSPPTTPLHTPPKPPHHRSKSTTLTPTHHTSSRRQKSLTHLKSPRSASHIHTQQRHSRSSLKSPRSASGITSSTTTTAHNHHKGSSAGVGGFGFVNFTEADRGKILTGVAPSGSSKTKARREMEAQEKKRRMSAAAMRAVQEAGGDVEGLRRVVELEGEC